MSLKLDPRHFLVNMATEDPRLSSKAILKKEDLFGEWECKQRWFLIVFNQCFWCFLDEHMLSDPKAEDVDLFNFQEQKPSELTL